MAEAKWRRYLRFWRPSIDADLDDELRFHFEERVEALISTGLTRDVARRQAEAEFGDVEAVRRGLREIDDRVQAARRRADWWDHWRQDFAYSARSLRRAPGLALTIIFTLALGIGINATLFTLLDRVFLRMPESVRRPSELRRFYWIGKSVNDASVAIPEFSIPIADGVIDAVGTKASTTVYRSDTKRVNDDKDPTTVVTLAGPRYFSVLGVQPAFGRFFTADEQRLDLASPVAVVSQKFWARRFGGSPADAIGQSIVLDKQRVTIVGVAPRKFTGLDLDATDVWVPLGMIGAFGTFSVAPGQSWYQSRTLYAFLLLGRSDTPARQLEAAATVGARRGFQADRWRKNAVVVTGPVIAARGPEPRVQELSISIRLAGVALIVLIIACANVANLLVARATGRQREVAVRTALGISRAGIIRLVLSESVLLALGAGALGFLLALWSSVLLRQLLFPSIHWPSGIADWRVAVFTLFITLVAGIGSGLLPALRCTRGDVSQTLKSGGREGSARRSRTRGVLVVVQAALSTVLLVGAVLFVKSLHAVRGLDLGYDMRRLMYVSVETHGLLSSPVTPLMESAGLRDLATRLEHVPGVERAALTSMVPLYEIDITTLFYRSGDSLPAWTDGAPTVIGVSPEFFATTGLRVVRGRSLTSSDIAAGNVAVVNETLARTAWPRADAIGQCLRLSKTGPCVTVIGIAEDARRAQLIETPVRQMYIALRPSAEYSAHSILLRVPPAHSAAVELAARREVAALFPGAEPHIRRMAEVLEPQYRPWELGATLFTVFGLLALVVAAIGVFSTLSHDSSQRRHELGVRVALGARAADVVRLILADGIRVVILGAALGTLLSLVGGRLVSSILYGVAPRDPVVLATVILILLLVATVASVIPAWRASRIDPMEALRAD